jgi:hypothetical protein
LACEIANNRAVSELPPSRKRAHAAWALGLRPRSGHLLLAAFALLLASLLEQWPSVARWLSDRLVLAFTRPLTVDVASLAVGSGVVLLGLLGLGGVAAVSWAPRRRALRALGVAPAAERIPAWISLALVSVALALIVVSSRGLLAGAARSVDASPEALTHAWIAWARRGLLTLAVVTAGIGMIERRLSARRLWRGLHQTPAQAREEARASGGRPPRRLT